MTSARATLLWSLLAGLLSFGASLHWDASPDLSGVMAEVDGVHPVRAAQALREAYVPGGGFLDKYPPLGSFLMGVVVAATDASYGAESATIPDLSAELRRPALWSLRERTRRLLGAERLVSRLALAGSVALLCALALSLLRRPERAARTAAASAVPAVAALLAALVFGCSAPALYYADTTNVDALALLGSLASVLLCVQRRWIGAAVALALATAVKDPAAALAPLILAGAWFDRLGGASGASGAAGVTGVTGVIGVTGVSDVTGVTGVSDVTGVTGVSGVSGVTGRQDSAARARRVAAVMAAGLLTYALASGAVTGPGVWWQHVRYLFAGGIAGVDRIDHAVPAQWIALVGYIASLVRGALGLGAALFGLLGLALLVRERGRTGWLLLAACLATPVLFVLPVGFVYARFLLVPMALLCAGLAVLLVRIAEGPAGRPTRLGLLGALACALLVVAGDRQMFDFHRHVVPALDARRAFAQDLPSRAPDGSRIVLFADEREHGPPLDPGRWTLDVAGLDSADARLRDWAAALPEERPDFVLWMSFPTDRPSGLPTTPWPLPEPGTRVGGVFEVVEVLAAPAPESWPVRSLAVRPQLMLLARLPP